MTTNARHLLCFATHVTNAYIFFQDSCKLSSELRPVHSVTPVCVANELYPKFEMPKSQLQVRQLIGQGAFGHVHEALAYGICDEPEKKPTRVAVKSLRGQ